MWQMFPSEELLQAIGGLNERSVSALCIVLHRDTVNRELVVTNIFEIAKGRFSISNGCDSFF